MTYVAYTEHMDSDERGAFDAGLVEELELKLERAGKAVVAAQPAAKPKSTNVEGVMAAFAMKGR